jgi:predicted DNA-binding protein YlxM (UPF0122 family)
MPRSDAKIDHFQALKQKMSGMSYQEIAKAQGVTKQSVHHAISPLLKQLPNAEEIAELKDRMGDLFVHNAARTLAHITDEKLANSSAKDLTLSAAISIDKHRLISGQSTSNQHIILGAIQAACEDD